MQKIWSWWLLRHFESMKIASQHCLKIDFMAFVQSFLFARFEFPLLHHNVTRSTSPGTAYVLVDLLQWVLETFEWRDDCKKANAAHFLRQLLACNSQLPETEIPQKLLTLNFCMTTHRMKLYVHVTRDVHLIFYLWTPIYQSNLVPSSHGRDHKWVCLFCWTSAVQWQWKCLFIVRFQIWSHTQQLLDCIFIYITP